MSLQELPLDGALGQRLHLSHAHLPTRLNYGEGSLHTLGRCFAFPVSRGTLCIFPHWVIKAPVLKQDVFCGASLLVPRKKVQKGQGPWDSGRCSLSPSLNW